MQDRGHYKDSINIVFLGTSYKDVSKFRKDSEKMMLSFLNTKPYDSYKERFNFFRIESFGDYGCNYDDAVVCNPSLAQREAIRCPGNDYIVILTDQSNVKNFFKHLRSSSWMNLMSLNVADDPLVFSHEFAHSFADFADEYEYGGEINWNAPNCDKDYMNCSKFSIINGSECHVGCVNNKYSRPIDVGIMRDYWVSKIYGAYDEWFLKSLVLDKTKEVKEDIKKRGDPKEKPEQVYVVSGSCDNGQCKILDVQKSPGYPTSYKGDSSLVVEVGEYSISVPQNNRIMTDFGLEKDVRYVGSYDFVVAVPVVEDKDILLTNDGKVEDFYSFEGKVTSFSKIIDIPKVSEG
jgi:hypothetical protein